MRLEMPDGTAVILAPHDDGILVGTASSRTARPSGLLVTGETAELLAALVETIEEAEAESLLDNSDADI